LTSATAVKFGNANATKFTVQSPTSITAISPPGTGTVDVSVTIGSVVSAVSAADRFDYGPTVSTVSPSSGPPRGGTSVIITGVNLTGATAVKFGSEPAAKFTVRSATSITAVSPAGAGTVDITVTTPGGTSPTVSTDRFTYETTIARLSPSTGPPTGGTTVGITGTNLSGATAVKFGSENATSFRVHSANFITAVAPPAGAGTVYVTVTAPGATTAIGSADQFTYTVPGEWAIFPSPSLGSGENSLRGVSCLSRRFCIAVGQDSAPGAEGLIEEWNGAAWSAVEAPEPRGEHDSDIGFIGVSCSSVKFCVAIGRGSHVRSPDSSGTISFVDTWNGATWSEARVGSLRTALREVSCVSPSFCVAVGQAESSGLDGGPQKTIVEFWNGETWSSATSADPGLLDELEGVSCVSITFCVAVGSFTDETFVGHALIESWNGTEWSQVPDPGTGSLKGVSCVSAKRCVAVGGSPSGTLVESWNGRMWSTLESPNPDGSGTPRLNAVSCVSARSCVAVGSDSTYQGPSQTLVETSKGNRWSIVPSANSASGVSYLNGVSCVSSESCFGVGEDRATPNSPAQALVETGGVQSFGGFGFSHFG
jgi:hypothetical protein